MKTTLRTILCLSLLTGCQEKPEDRIIAKKSYDENYIVVYDYQKLGEPTKSEIAQVDSLLKEAVNDYNLHPDRHFTIGNSKPRILDLKDYKRQYFLSLNEKREKEIEVRCFCDLERKDWKTRNFYAMAGGGDCYFVVRINLSTNKFEELFPNGPA